jgi:hypothetical protein
MSILYRSDRRFSFKSVAPDTYNVGKWKIKQRRQKYNGFSMPEMLEKDMLYLKKHFFDQY